ncbi:hypothetical protein D3C72_1277180 [compost metagenome]
MLREIPLVLVTPVWTKFLMLFGYAFSSVGMGLPFSSSGLFHWTALYPLSSAGPTITLDSSSITKLPGRSPGRHGKVPLANLLCNSINLYGISNTVLLVTAMVIFSAFLPLLVVISTTPLPAREP